MAITLYGISNCDTVRKTRKWAKSEDISITYHDFRKDGLDAALVQKWAGTLGTEVLLNKRGTTWRNLSEDEKASDPIGLMVANPALIKRPVIDADGVLSVGFTTEIQDRLKELQG